MNEFKRGITNKAFINALNELYKDENSFWYKMVKDKELYIAIRKECINVYYNGQSICELKYSNKNIVKGKTHRKYLGVEENGYFISENGKIIDEKSKIKSLSEINQIKENVKKHIGKEKGKLYTEILNNEMCILDVEITFVKNKVDNPKNKSDYEISSIDYVAIEQNEEHENKLVFYEAKHFCNSEIRSRTKPKVLRQISRYEEALHLHEKEVLISYHQIFQNLRDLHILALRNTLYNKLTNEKISIDFEPRLIIFEISKDKKDDKHLETLRKHFGNKLILKYK